MFCVGIFLKTEDYEGRGGRSSSYIQVNMTLFFLFMLKKCQPFIQMNKLEFLSLPSYRINATFKPSVEEEKH